MSGRIGLCGGMLVLAAMAAWAQQLPKLPNGDFEQGDENAPAAWKLDQPERGTWLKGAGVDGGAAISISGNGHDDAAWASDGLAFPPHRCFRFTFLARSLDANGGTVVCGPASVNVDIGIPRKEWTAYANIFCTGGGKDRRTVVRQRHPLVEQAILRLFPRRHVVHRNRARELLVAVGDEAAIRRMVENDKRLRRYSALRWRLAQE